MRLDIELPPEWAVNDSMDEMNEVAAALVYKPSREWFIEVYEGVRNTEIEVSVLSGTPSGGTWERANAKTETYDEAEAMVKMAMAYYPEGYDNE
jgi:hypothetical protein